MEIVEAFSVKQEPTDYPEGQADYPDQKCVICDREVPGRQFWDHVKEQHGFNEVEYQSVAKNLQSRSEDEAAKKGKFLLEDGCKFKCTYCSNKETSWRRMTNHIHKTHKGKKKKVHDPFDLIVDYKIVDCQECKKPILQDRVIMYRHMLQDHKIKISTTTKVDKKTAMKKRRDVGNECKFKCKFCPKVLECWMSTLRHHNKNHMKLGKIAPPLDSVIKSKFHDCSRCGKELLKDNMIIYDHMRVVHQSIKIAKGKSSSMSTSGFDITRMVEDDCRFQCKYCPEVYQSWQLFASHHETNHKSLASLPQPYAAVIESHYHRCCLCSREVLKDNLLVYNHIKLVHKLTSKSYKRWLELQSKYGESGLMAKAEDEGQGGTDEELMVNGCKFKCKACDHESPSWRNMVAHNVNKHKNKKKLEPFELVVDAKVYECYKCKKPMLQDRSFIKNHFRTSHKNDKITFPPIPQARASQLYQARKLFTKKQMNKNPNLVKNECKFKCKFCPQVFESWKSASEHHRVKHKSEGMLALPNDSVIESKIHVCQICGKEILKDNYLISNHMRGAHNRVNINKMRGNKKQQEKEKAASNGLDIIVENGCTFQCKHCPQVLDSWEGMTDHQTSHDSLESAICPNDSVIQRKVHTCCICGIEVLRDNTLIQDHIREAHNLTAKSYKRWLEVKAQVQKGTEEESGGENVQINDSGIEEDTKLDNSNSEMPLSKPDDQESQPGFGGETTLEDSEDETDVIYGRPQTEKVVESLDIKQEPSDTVELEKDESKKKTKNQHLQITLTNDSHGRFVQTVADHLGEANLSKGAMLALQSKILATIADHIS